MEQTNTSLLNAEVVHEHSTTAFENAKISFLIVFVLEFAVVLTGIFSSAGEGNLKWYLLGITILLIFSTVFRLYALSLREYGDHFRLESLGAVIEERDVSSHVRSEAESTALLTLYKPKIKPLQEYYSPSFTSGMKRRRELYAQNAFYTWRYTNVMKWVAIIISLFLLIIAFVLFTNYFNNNSTDVSSQGGMQFLFLVIIAFFLLRWVEFSVVTHKGAMKIKRIADDLLNDSLDLDKLTREYDTTASNLPCNPSCLHSLLSERLSTQWDSRRKELLK